jgi:hypothetical protein
MTSSAAVHTISVTGAAADRQSGAVVRHTLEQYKFRELAYPHNTLLQQWARLARAVLCTDRDDRDHLLQASVRNPALAEATCTVWFSRMILHHAGKVALTNPKPEILRVQLASKATDRCALTLRLRRLLPRNHVKASGKALPGHTA